jgi:hypothetical protein
LFVCLFVELGSHFLPQPAWTEIFLFLVPPIAGMTGAHHHTKLFSVEIEPHELFGPGWPGTVILTISASKVGRIIGMSH